METTKQMKRNFDLIREAIKAIKPYLSDVEYDDIKVAYKIAQKIEDNPYFYFLNGMDGAEMFNYEHVVRIVAEEKSLTHLTDPFLNDLERELSK